MTVNEQKSSTKEENENIDESLRGADKPQDGVDDDAELISGAEAAAAVAAAASSSSADPSASGSGPDGTAKVPSGPSAFGPSTPFQYGYGFQPGMYPGAPGGAVSPGSGSGSSHGVNGGGRGAGAGVGGGAGANFYSSVYNGGGAPQYGYQYEGNEGGVDGEVVGKKRSASGGAVGSPGAVGGAEGGAGIGGEVGGGVEDRQYKRRFANRPTIASAERPYPCKFDGCPWAFARLSDQRRHYRSHQKPTFNCPYWASDPTCHRNGGAFNRLDVLKRHLRLVHFVQFKQSDSGWCRVCQRMFTNPKHFVEHCERCAQASRPTEWKVDTDRGTLLNSNSDVGSEQESLQKPSGARTITITDERPVQQDVPTLLSLEAATSDQRLDTTIQSRPRVSKGKSQSSRKTLSHAIQAGSHVAKD